MKHCSTSSFVTLCVSLIFLTIFDETIKAISNVSPLLSGGVYIRRGSNARRRRGCVGSAPTMHLRTARPSGRPPETALPLPAHAARRRAREGGFSEAVRPRPPGPPSHWPPHRRGCGRERTSRDRAPTPHPRLRSLRPDPRKPRADDDLRLPDPAAIPGSARPRGHFTLTDSQPAIDGHCSSCGRRVLQTRASRPHPIGGNLAVPFAGGTPAFPGAPCMYFRAPGR